MMHRLSPLALLLLLAACGADGLPRAPGATTAPATGPVTLSGEMRVGISN